jgi:D-serine deaminase-like pyridoxal phosphate-dependent protein
MGQLSLSQQAIRAAGLDCHPPHSITPLATSERTQMSAAVKLSARRTLTRMSERD